MLAFASVRPEARLPFFLASGVLALGLAARQLVLARLARRLGPGHFALRARGAPPEPVGARTEAGAFTFDTRAIGPPAPLLWPGLAFLGLAVLQLLPGGPGTSSREATARGAAFLASVLAVHAASAVAFESSAARRGLRWSVAGLGFVLAVLALGQRAADPSRLYGRFAPLESATFFGPFANPNHFAGYMLMVVPLALAELVSAAERVRAGARRPLAALATPAGTRVLYAGLLTLGALAALAATASRAALLAFAASLLLGALGWRRRRAPGALLLGLVLAGVALGLVGLARLEERFAQSVPDAAGRFGIWGDVAAGMDGRWLFGHGFNTFGHVFGRTTPWELPQGATPWPAELTAAARAGERPAYRSPPGVAGLEWYREAHNDYVQVVAETGLSGLALVGWALFSVLRAARSRPWQLAAVTGIALHEAVDFDLQVPAVAVLFAVVSGLPERGRP